MANLMDIYHNVGKELYEWNFDFQPTAEKKKLVDRCLKTYIAGKVAEESITKAAELINNGNTTLIDYVTALGDLIPQEQHFDTMRHLTHFLLNIAGEMQGWSITWYSDNSPEFIGNLKVSFNDEHKIDSLTTHPETSYVDTFKFVHEIFSSAFTKDTEAPKQLILVDLRGEESNK